MNVPVCVPLDMLPESVGRGVGPLVNVTLCCVAPSFQVQVTVLPLCTTTLEGLNAMFCRVTAPEVGGAAAVAENVSVGSVVIAGVAVTDCGVDDPMLSVARSK